MSRTHVKRYQESKIWIVQRVGEYLEKPRELLVTLLLGNELCNVAISIVGAALVSQFFPGDSKIQMFIAIVTVTPIILVFGEIIPKNIALRLAPQLAPIAVALLRVFHVLVTPLRIILGKIADGFVRLFGGKPDQADPMVMEEEFRRLVDLGKEEGVLIDEEHELIHNVFEFTNKVVREIMIPAEQLFMLSVDIDYQEMLEEIKATEFRRIPVYENDRNNIVGILHVRDLYAFDRRRLTEDDLDIKDILHRPLFIDQDAAIERLLRKIQRDRVHMAIVANRQREVLGIATLHDVLEELFGAIESE